MSVIIAMKHLEIKGFKIKLTKYKLIIFDREEGGLKDNDAYTIAQYLYDEGFIEKDNFPVEIMPSDQ
jgi:hypothetical protein